MFSAVSPQGETEELPEFLLQLPPEIERARTSEGSFGSVHLSPANISLVNGEYSVVPPNSKPFETIRKVMIHKRLK